MSSMTGSRGYGPTGARQNKVAGYDVASLSNYGPDVVETARKLYGKTVPGMEAGIDYNTRLASGDQSMFDELEAPALRQFGQQQSQIASRFSGGGGGDRAMSSRRGSGFYNAQNSAAMELSEKLSSQRQALRRQAINDLRGMSKELLEPQRQNQMLVKPKVPGWQKFVGGALPLIGAGVGAFGGPMGMALGASVGSQLGGAFSGSGGGQMDYSGIGNLPTNWS